jgi:NTE family protein
MPAKLPAALLSAAAFFSLQAMAQQAAPQGVPGKPRVGVALSGGGARGLAHIGVLKVLEEMRVPVSCVTGTSMGAVVGGAFASGRTPGQMEDTVLKTDWDAVFSDRPPRQEVSIRRKADDYKTLIAPEFGLNKDGLALPKGIIAGLSIESYFRALIGPSGDIADFGKLPVPFRAMASDIVTGESVVLQSGSVSQAMRASMSVPGAVAPVEINGRLLVDGGIANNLPIDEARKLCGDVIIAVNISTPPLKREEITSALSVSLQLVNLLGKATVEQQVKSLGERDVLIEPALGDISAGSFERAKDAIRIGEEAARALAGQLQRYSVPAEEYAALRLRQTVAIANMGKVDEIRFHGLRRSNPEVLQALVQSKPGEELTEEAVGSDLRRIYGRGDFESVDYRIVQEPGKRVLLIEPKEKSWGPDYLRFGLGLATDFSSDSQFNLLVSYRKTLLNRLGGEWLSEVQVGKENRLYTEFYQPIEERGRFFVAPNASISQGTRGVYLNGDRVAEYQINRGRISLDVGTTLGTWGELRIGPTWQHIKASVDTGSPLLPTVSENSAGMALRLVGDHLDHAWFARDGHRTILTAYMADKAFGSANNYKRLEANVTMAMSWGPHTFNGTVRGGTALNSPMPAYETFTLGGPLQLSGYRIGEFSGRELAFGRLMYYNRAIKLPDILGSGVYVGGSLEAGRIMNRFDGLPNDNTKFSGSVFLAADSFLGPAFVGVGAAPGGRWNIYLLLGAP